MEIIIEESKNKTFEKVSIRKPQVEDLIQAERIAGKSDGLTYALALLSRIATFDGEKLLPEDLTGISAEDFLQLSQALMGSGLKDLAKQLLNSAQESDSKE